MRAWHDRDGRHWWFTPAEAAHILHVSPKTVRRWMREGRLRTRAGRVHIQEATDLRDLLETRRRANLGPGPSNGLS